MLSFLQSRDYISKAQAGQSAEKFTEVISRLRFSSDEGVKYSGDLLAIMETLRNTTELCKANGLRLNNADVEVSRSFFEVGTSACIFYFFSLLRPIKNSSKLSSNTSASARSDLQNYVQTISNLLKEEHRDKWEEAQLVSDKRVTVHEWRGKEVCCANALVT